MARYYWNMAGYRAKYVLHPDSCSMKTALHFLQLEPAPPAIENLNDYVMTAIRKKDPLYLSFFLHFYEPMLNGRIRSFLFREGYTEDDAERFMDWKLECVLTILEKFPRYKPHMGTAFTTFLYRMIGDALLTCRMRDEYWGFDSLDQYKNVRRIASLFHNTDEVQRHAVAAFAEQQGCSPEKAAQLLKTALAIRQRKAPFRERETGETADEFQIADPSTFSDMHDQLRYIGQGRGVKKAFQKLGYRSQVMLEGRLAFCKKCWVERPLETRLSFEQLATMFEGGSPRLAQRGFEAAVEELLRHMQEQDLIRLAEIRLLSKKTKAKKIASAVYRYQADCEGEWGEIQFDFQKGTAEILSLADWDTTVTRLFAANVIEYVKGCDPENLPRSKLLAIPQ